MEKPRFCSSDLSQELPGVVIDSLEDIIYVSDPVSFDVLWLNCAGQKLFGVKDIRGRKCYQFFQGLDSPCPYCPLDVLGFDFFHKWEHANPVTGQCFLVKDKLISWKGRTLHLEIAMDITEVTERRRNIQRNLETERTLVECVRALQEEETLSSAIREVLARAGRQYGAERAYVFELDRREGRESAVDNTHEWCAEGIEPQRELLQQVPFDITRSWFEMFENRQEVIIDDLEDIRGQYPVMYAALKRQGIRRLFAVQLRAGGCQSFIGVDNPHPDIRDLSLLHTLAYFVDIEVSKRQTAEELRRLGLRDALTGLGNRNAYLVACNALKSRPHTGLGVIFVDLNNLKYVNDNFGHERGDEYIRSLSEEFLKHFRSRDIFRIGGDEFVFLCEDMPEALFDSKIKTMVREGERRFPGSIALGAVWRPQATDVESMVQQADQLMYAEKLRQKAERASSSGAAVMPDLAHIPVSGAN